MSTRWNLRARTAILLAACLLLPQLLAGQEAAAEAEKAPPPEPREAVTHHSLEIGGETLGYTAVAGEIYLRDAGGKPEASIFSISYFLEGVDDPSRRPVTFFFNGGPGSTATWLHLGAFGPRRLDLGEDPLTLGAPPYPLRPNPHSLLDVSDLVFVDPVGTGYSRALGEGKDSDYWGVNEDAAALGRFIRTYLTHHRRWDSPKYLAGESYGTIRSSLLIRDLALPPLDGVAFNGVILISSALDARPILSGLPGNDLAYVTLLPTYAVTAYYHDRLPEKPADLEAFLREARELAGGEYLTALFRGDTLPEEEEAAVADRLHHFTGLSQEYLRRSHLRVPSERFIKELLRERGEILAIHDTRFRGRDPDEAGEAAQWDPFLFGIAGPFVTAINGYLGGPLELEMDRSYSVFNLDAAIGWKGPEENQGVFAGFLHVTAPLAQAAATNADFRVFVANGYHDLVTTFFGAEHTFDHSGIPRDRITQRNYHGGHMMYLYEPSLARLAADVRAFIGGPPT